MASSRELTSLLSSADVVAALEGHYERAIERIIRELARGVSRPGSARAQELLGRIRELAKEINPNRDSKIRRWIEDNVPDAFILGDKSAVRQLREELQDASPAARQEFGDLNRAFTSMNSTALRAITASMKDSLNSIHQQILTTSQNVVRRTQLVFQQDAAVRDAVVSGLIRGGSGRELSDDIATIILKGKESAESLQNLRQNGFQNDTIDLYDRLSKGQFLRVGERNFSVRAYANLTARTMLREAHKVGTKVRLQQNGVDHIRISKHAQDKPDVCTPFAGRVFYIGAEEADPLGFPPLKSITNGGPPFHPNCAHVLEPYVAVLKTQNAVDVALEDADALPRRFFAKSAAEVTELVEVLDEAALREIDLQNNPKRAA
ncbi:MAG TPA: phage minor capsid protein [Planctomycetota bacterium]|nr:phage minor capsid protein [Planctomycetota bacterium]